VIVINAVINTRADGTVTVGFFVTWRLEARRVAVSAALRAGLFVPHFLSHRHVNTEQLLFVG